MTHDAPPPPRLTALKLADFGELQARYQSLKLAARADAMLVDAEPALQAAERILTRMADHAQCPAAFQALRKNSALIGRMRPSEARTLLLDSSDDFIATARRKLAAWRKTLQRIAAGEDIAAQGGKEYIPANAPLALAIIGIASVGHYLSIAQLALGELSKQDKENGASYASTTAEIRRCATLLGDCESAAGLHGMVR